MSTSTNNQSIKGLEPFEFHGVEFNKRSGDQWIGACPFCMKDDHLYARFDNKGMALWDCKRCDAKGNTYSFLKQLHNRFLEETSDERYKALAKDRKIPWQRLKTWQLAYDVGSESWLIPYASSDNGLVNLGRYTVSGKKRREYFTKGCRTYPFGKLQLGAASRKDEPVYLCEGPWDTIAMDNLLRRAKQPGIAIGVPGAQTFKPDWAKWFSGRVVRLSYDHDTPGYNGMQKVAQILGRYAKSLEVIDWEDELPDGFDVRDYVAEGREQIRAEDTTWPRLLEEMRFTIPNTPVTATTQSTNGFVPVPAKEILKEPSPRHLIDPFLPELSLCVLVAPPNVGKTTLLLGMAVSIATGRPFLGRKTEKTGSVLYVPAEGWRGLPKRLHAQLEHHGIAESDVPNLYIVKQTPNLLLDEIDDEEESLGSEVMAAIETWRPVNPELIVIDPLNFAMDGGDENSARDMSKVCRSAGLIRDELGCAVVFAHHTNKDNRSERGSSVLRGAVDVQVTLQSEGSGVKIKCTKMRDFEKFGDCGFELLVVNPPNQPSSVVAHSIQIGDLQASKEAATRLVNRQKILDVLAKRQGQETTTAEMKKLIKLSQDAWTKAKDDLIENGEIENKGSGNKANWQLMKKDEKPTG